MVTIDFPHLTEIYPFLSLFFSLILFLGLYAIGEAIFSNKKIQLIFLNISELKYQNILIAVNFLMFVLFPIVLFFPYSRILLNFFSIFIFIFGVCKICLIAKEKPHIKIPKLNPEIILFFLLIVGFFLITFSPVNHADSLDYHMSGALHIFKTGKLPATLDNFHNLLIGSGEVFYSLGFFFGAEQFGTLVQFSGLLSLIGIIKKFRNKNNIFFILLILSSPILIFLASSPKPQLFQICSNAIIFVLLFINFNSIKENKINFFLVIIVNIFLINSINAKFSFILSAFILYVLLCIFSYKKKFFLQTILLSFVLLFFFYLNFSYWKSMTWGGNLLNYIVNPFPAHLQGVEFFKNYLINYKRESFFVYLFLPKSLGEFTDALGIGFIICIYFFFKKKNSFIIFVPFFLFFILINYFFGQPSGRFFLEPYIWSILLAASIKRVDIPSKFKILFYPQFLLAILALWYGVFFMSYGFINNNLRNKVMSNTADGYSLFSWSNSFVKKEDTVISMHRSVALGKANTLSTTFLYYVHSQVGDLYSYQLKKRINESNPKGSIYLLTLHSKSNLGIFSNCIDFLYKEKKNVGMQVGRNPFNKTAFYNGYLFKLKNIEKTGCLK